MDGQSVHGEPVTPDLRRFFAPRSVALVGATADLGKFGGRCFRQLIDFGYSGTIYPVNPRLSTLHGLTAYPDVASLPEAPDHVLIVVPSKAIPDTIRQCGERGVKYATIFSSGFAEGGSPEGRAFQEEVTALARQCGVRFMGPNCNGLVNYVDGVAMTSTATVNGPRPPHGDVAVLGHSGGLAQVNVMWRAMQAGLGISYQVSSGNDADLDMLDYAQFLSEDPHTRVILMLAETVKNPAKLRHVAEQARLAGKPVIMLKLGRTEEGRRAAVMHTGARSGDDAVADDILRQLGILRVNDCREMIDAAMVLRQKRSFAGGRLAAISISGGNLVHLADQAPRKGLSFARFSDTTRERLSALIPNYGQAENPADVTSAAIGSPAIFSGVLEAVAADESVDAVLPVLTIHSRQIIEAAAETCAACGKPYALLWVGACTDDPELTQEALVRRGMPVYRDIEPAMGAIRLAVDHAGRAARQARPQRAPELAAEDVRAWLDALPGTEGDAAILLERAGIPVAGGAAETGVEWILRLSEDSIFGPILSVGLGGSYGALLDDFAHRILPLDEAEARAMLAQLRASPLLNRKSDGQQADLDALVALLLRMSDMGAAGDIALLELDPVIVARDGGGVTIGNARLVRR